MEYEGLDSHYLEEGYVLLTYGHNSVENKVSFWNWKMWILILRWVITFTDYI